MTRKCENTHKKFPGVVIGLSAVGLRIENMSVRNRKDV